jgi:hypothetical protein
VNAVDCVKSVLDEGNGRTPASDKARDVLDENNAGKQVFRKRHEPAQSL